MARTLRIEAFLGGLVLGAILGGSVGLLLAPVAGSEARSRLGEQGIVLKQRAEDVANRIVHREAMIAPPAGDQIELESVAMPAPPQVTPQQ